MTARFIQGVNKIQGANDGLVVPTGYIGETKSIIQSGAINIATNSNYTNVGSVLVPKGVWSIFMHAIFAQTGTVTLSELINLGYSTDSTTGFSDFDISSARTNTVGGTGNCPLGTSFSQFRGLSTGNCTPIVVTSDTTYYLKIFNRASAGSYDVVGARLIFTRIG